MVSMLAGYSAFFSAQSHLDLSYDGSSCMFALHASVSLKSIHSLDFEQRLFIGLHLSSVFSED